MKSRPMMKAWASPLRLGLLGVVEADAELAAVAEQRLEPGRSRGVEMTRMSRMPASISTLSG